MNAEILGTSKDRIQVASSYRFHSISGEAVGSVRAALVDLASHEGVLGLVILGTEGINLTVARGHGEFGRFLRGVETILGASLDWKLSETDSMPFKKFKVKIREEIVTIGNAELLPGDSELSTHVSPEDWDQLMKDPDVIVLDTRNTYETEIGKFKGAVTPDIEEFREFGPYLQRSDLPKDKKYLIYCTGGIRCEKAILEMHRQGYQKVHQLDGGILKYLEQRPNAEFEGECFVFDYRVAVDQELQPTQSYKFCPHCGQPAKVKLNCSYCGDEATVCQRCLDKAPEYQTCSKNCAHHKKLGHRFRRRHLDKVRRAPPVPTRVDGAGKVSG